MHPALAHHLYFTLQALRREPLRAALVDVQRSDAWSLDQLRAEQARRQISQLRFAIERVPHYQSTVGSMRSRIVSARTWEDVSGVLADMPVLEKGSVMDHPAALTANNAAELPTHLDRTSGSSGTPVVFPCDQRSWAYRHALTFHCMSAFGVTIGEPYALFFGLHWSTQARFKVAVRDYIFNRVRVSAYEVGREKFWEHLAAIRKHRPTHIQGYPSAVYEFCALARELGVDLGELKLKAVFLTSEPLRPHQRSLIEQVTRSRCVDIYGSAEGGITAYECPAGGMHTTPIATWFDVRTTATHASEAVVTDLMLRAFPMIRYAMGDEIALRAGTCACGRAAPLIGAIEGRSGEPIELPDGRTLNANLPSYIFKPLAELGVIRRYRFVQADDGSLELFLVVTAGFATEHLERVRSETARAFGEDVPVAIRVVDALPHLANAKHRDFVRRGVPR